MLSTCVFNYKIAIRQMVEVKIFRNSSFVCFNVIFLFKYSFLNLHIEKRIELFQNLCCLYETNK